MADDKPDPRFEHFTEVLGEDGKPIGFKLDNNNFLFKYDQKGGWHDEENNYYNAHGVFLYKEDEWEKEDNVEQDLVHEMEDLIKKEEGDDGASSESDEEPLPVEQIKQTKPKKELTLDEKIFQALDQIAKGQNVKAFKKGAPVRIYIKMRAAAEIDIIKIDSSYELKQLDTKITAERKKIDEKTDLFKKELPKEAHITFSVQDKKIYWFGYIATDVEHFKAVFEELSKSKSFGILKRKTLLHLRFFISNEKEIAAQKSLSENLSKLPNDQPVCLKIVGIPEFSPLSYIVDLLEECGLNAKDVQSIKMKEKQADIIIKRQQAPRLLELQGFEKDQQVPIHLEIVPNTEKFIEGEHFKVILENEKQSAIPIQIELLLINDLGCAFSAKDGLIGVHANYLKQVLHYRDNKLVPLNLEKISVPK